MGGLSVRFATNKLLSWLIRAHIVLRKWNIRPTWGKIWCNREYQRCFIISEIEFVFTIAKNKTPSKRRRKGEVKAHCLCCSKQNEKHDKGPRSHNRWRTSSANAGNLIEQTSIAFITRGARGEEDSEWWEGAEEVCGWGGKRLSPFGAKFSKQIHEQILGHIFYLDDCVACGFLHPFDVDNVGFFASWEKAYKG